MKAGQVFAEGSRWLRLAASIESVCGGSGFDGAWSFEDKGAYIKAETRCHLTDDRGLYRGRYPFMVIIPKKDPGNFRMYGKGDSRRVLEAAGVWEYAEEMLCFAVSNGWKEETV
jgi:hypothetical protein